jgi:hypothetical protein
LERRREAVLALLGQLDVDDAGVVRRGAPLDQAGRGGTVDELGDRALGKVQSLGELGDRRPRRPVLGALTSRSRR